MSNVEKARLAWQDMEKQTSREPSNDWSWPEIVFIPHIEAQYKAVFERNLDWKTVKLLDLGSGADFSLYGYKPLLCRYAATIPVQVAVGVDKDKNDPNIEDEYHHIQMTIDPNDESFPTRIFSELDRRGISTRFNIITSFNFAEIANTAPELKLASNPITQNIEEIHALITQRNFSHMSFFWKEEFKTRVIQWAFTLLEEDGALFFGNDQMVYRKHGDSMIGYIVNQDSTYQHEQIKIK